MLGNLFARNVKLESIAKKLAPPRAQSVRRENTQVKMGPLPVPSVRLEASHHRRAQKCVIYAKSARTVKTTAPWRVAYVWCQRLLWHQALQIVPPASKTTIGTIGNVKDGARASSARRELTVRILATASSRRSLSRKGTFVFLRRRSVCTSATLSKITRNNAAEGARPEMTCVKRMQKVHCAHVAVNTTTRPAMASVKSVQQETSPSLLRRCLQSSVLCLLQ